MSGAEGKGGRGKPSEDSSADGQASALAASPGHGDVRLADVLEDLEDGYYEVDLAGNFTAVNNALCRMHGLERGEILGRNNRDYTEPDVASRMFETFNQVYRTGEPVKFFIYENIRADGTNGVEEISVHLIRNEAGEPVGFRGITRDVTDRQRNEAYEQARNRALEALARHAPLGATLGEVLEGLRVQMPDSCGAILTLGHDGESLDVAAASGAAAPYLERFQSLRLGREGLLLATSRGMEPEVTIRFSREVDAAPDAPAAAAGLRARTIQRILSSDGDMLGVLLVFWERERVDQGREAEWLQAANATAEIAISHHDMVSRLAYLSQRDALTGLLNRRSFIEEGTRGLALARRHGWTPGLAFLDLDRFKSINDTHGHLAGDRLLTAVAARLLDVVRESDTLARLGGDEFAIFAPDLGETGGEPLARRIQAGLSEPMDIGIGQAIQVNASIGITLAGSAEASLDDLLARADGAMYEAKSRGGGWELAGSTGRR